MIMTIKKIGNSQGILLPKQLMALCSIKDTVTVRVENNEIIIAATNNPRSEWDAQFKAAITNSKIPENDVFEGIENDFDKNEWTW